MSDRITEKMLREVFGTYITVLQRAGMDTEGLALYREGSMYTWKLIYRRPGESGHSVLRYVGDSNKACYHALAFGILTADMIARGIWGRDR